MKRRDLIRHIERHGCERFREGGSHSIYINRGESALHLCAAPA